MLIGDLARAAQINVSTIRYYQRRGLIPEPARRESGYREYDTEALDAIVFIRRAQDLGFTLDRINLILRLRKKPESSSLAVREQAEECIKEIRSMVVQLQSMESRLAGLLSTCCSDVSISECTIIQQIQSTEGDRHGSNSGSVHRRVPGVR